MVRKPIRHIEGTRRTILEAALRLFDEHGFRDTSMSALAKEAGVGAGTIYRHFEHKEDLVESLYEAARDEAHRSVLTMGFDEGAPVRDRLYTTWRAVILNYIDCPRLYRFILKYESSAYLRAKRRAQTEDLRTPFRQIYEDGVAQGLFAPLPESVYASFFTGALSHLVQEHLNDGLALDDEMIDRTFEMLWAAYTNEGSSRD